VDNAGMPRGMQLGAIAGRDVAMVPDHEAVPRRYPRANVVMKDAV
jgi:hypothetical protein